MMLFRLPAIQSQSHRIMIWGYEKTWSQLGRWDYAPIIWHFEKALHETAFDRESTKIHPIQSRSSFADEILASLKKATLSLKKLHSRNIELFCIAKLKGEDKFYIEGTAPSWVKLMQVSATSQDATLKNCVQGEWFSLDHNPADSFYFVRPDIVECPHQLEISEPGVCRFETLSEWLSTSSPSAINFNPEEL